MGQSATADTCVSVCISAGSSWSALYSWMLTTAVNYYTAWPLTHWSAAKSVQQRALRKTSTLSLWTLSMRSVASCLVVYPMHWRYRLSNHVPSVHWHCWLGVRKSMRPVKFEWWGIDVVICVEQGADCLHDMALLMPLLSFLVPGYPGCPSSVL